MWVYSGRNGSCRTGIVCELMFDAWCFALRPDILCQFAFSVISLLSGYLGLLAQLSRKTL